MSLVIEIFAIILFIIVVDTLNSMYSLLLYGIFMAYVALNFDLYFSTGVSESAWTPFATITALVSAFSFVKMIWIISRKKPSSPDGEM